MLLASRLSGPGAGTEARVDDVLAERIARNDATFREANERINRSAQEYGIRGRIPFLCECADASCTEVVPMTAEEYERVRSDGRDFLNAPGHDAASGAAGEVIVREPRYTVVRTVGRAAELALELDTRSSHNG